MGWEIERIPVKPLTTDEAIKELSLRLTNAEEVSEGKGKIIRNLQDEVKQAGDLCKKLTEEKAQIEEEYSKLLDKQYQDDYKIQNSKKIVENLNKTLERYETENKALRAALKALVSLWV